MYGKHGRTAGRLFQIPGLQHAPGAPSSVLQLHMQERGARDKQVEKLVLEARQPTLLPVVFALSFVRTGAVVPFVIAATIPKIVVGVTLRNLALRKRPHQPHFLHSLGDRVARRG